MLLGDSGAAEAGPCLRPRNVFASIHQLYAAIDFPANFHQSLLLELFALFEMMRSFSDDFRRRGVASARHLVVDQWFEFWGQRYVQRP